MFLLALVSVQHCLARIVDNKAGWPRVSTVSFKRRTGQKCEWRTMMSKARNKSEGYLTGTGMAGSMAKEKKQLFIGEMDLSSSNTSSSTASSSLDCKKGLECSDYECELRHLDAIEQTRYQGTAFRSCAENNRPNLIITASRDVGRTASTWVFNAVRLMYRQARMACDSYWIRELSQAKLQQRVMNRDAAHVLVKTHEQGSLSQEEFDRELLPMFTHVIVSVRNGFPPDPAWIKVATHVIHYEDIVADNEDGNMSQGALSVLRGLTEHLRISQHISDDDIRTVDFELMTLPIPGDQSTKFWSFHSRRGGRSQPTKHPVALEQQLPIRVPARTNHIFVTRHGARIDNGGDRDPNWLRKAGHGRPQDAHLSLTGHQAAAELASALVRRCRQEDGIALDHIVSSPFLRCMETVIPVAKALNLRIKVEPGIAEIGSTASQMAPQSELERRFSPFIDPDYNPVMSRKQLTKSEWSDEAAASRAASVAKTVQSRLGGGTILFVGHGASCLGLVRAFGAEGYVGYCSLSHFQRTPVSDDDSKIGKWQLVGSLGDVSHLSDPETALDSAW